MKRYSNAALMAAGIVLSLFCHAVMADVRLDPEPEVGWDRQFSWIWTWKPEYYEADPEASPEALADFNFACLNANAFAISATSSTRHLTTRHRFVPAVLLTAARHIQPARRSAGHVYADEKTKKKERALALVERAVRHWSAGGEPVGVGNFTFDLRFPGQYFDKESGLHYN
jgi:hypothetical protein